MFSLPFSLHFVSSNHFSTVKSCSAALLLALAAAGPLGCQSDGSDMNDGAYDRHADMMKMPAAKNDGEFASLMAAHHNGTIEMGRYQAQNGTRAEVRAIAGKMADAQSTEKVKLLAISRETGQSDTNADSMMRENMDRCMMDLRNARGTQVDSVYLTHMIKHHKAGVEMARNAMPNLRRDDTRQMAQLMIDDQTREIEQMRAMVN